ncbi:MAG: ATP-binding protein, partial [Candidatus Aenigmarchaeota archaeon]|nr:ATP-binding protein [Candidatus Aenigmarchaeota archaeon]
GSVKSLISKNYGNLISGRHKTVEFFPLSFREFLKFRGFSDFDKFSEEKEAKIKKLVEEFMHKSAFPKYVLTGDFSYVEEVFGDIIERDVKSRTEIRKKEIIDDIINLLTERVGSLISFTKIKNILKNKGHKISTDLVIRYSSILENVFLFFFLPIYSSKYSQVVKNPRKVYIIDNGFFNLFNLNFSQNNGKLMENTVALELLKKGWKAGKNLFYYRKSDFEVDFLIKDGLKVKQLIQVCYDIENYDTKKRELKALIRASDELKCNDLLVITWDYEVEEEINGKKIKFVPLWKWMLQN